MNNIELEMFYDAVSKIALRMFDDFGRIMPTYICVTGDGDIFPVPAPDMPNKNILVAVMRKFFAAKNVVMYAHMDEAWMLDGVKPPPGVNIADHIDAEYEKYGGSLKNHPDRIEVVNIIAEQGMNTLTGVFKVIRPKDGKPSLEAMGKPTTRSTGRFIGLLMPNRTRQ